MPKEISNQQKAFFQENGYVYWEESIFSDNDLEALTSALYAIFHGNYRTKIAPARHFNQGESEKLQKIDNFHFADDQILDRIPLKKIGERAAQIMDAQMIQLWATQLVIKPAMSGALGNVGWHADQHNWELWDGNVFTAWIPLTDMVPQSGPITHVDQSHLWQKALPMESAYSQNLDLSQFQDENVFPEAWKQTPMLLRAGELSLHHRWTLHCSGPNETEKDRLALALNLRTERSRLQNGVEDFGYHHLIQDLHLCPIIYRSEIVSEFH